MSRVIDLRSDTVTLPTPEMMEAMRSAPLGDDGLDGDPTVATLEALAAERMGKEQALFVSSGTMGNLVAALTHGCRGGEAVMDTGAHIAVGEAGGISRLAGMMCRTLPAVGGEMDLDTVKAALRSDYTRHGQPTAMVVVESSHNHAGGAVPSLAYMRGLHELAKSRGAAVHLDGARIFNAAASLGCDVSRIAAYADSASFCLSKGLSAPIGSVLVGATEFISRARTFRRMVGGNLRQAGVVAAAGIVALRRMTVRLEEDHRHAHALWLRLRGNCPSLVSEQPPMTNIVMLSVGATGISAERWLAELERRGLRTRARDPATLRLVLHRHIDESMAIEAADRVSNAWGELRATG